MISSHGAHSSGYCEHAHDPLEEILAEYYRQNFSHVVVSEHIPPPDNAFLYPDERKKHTAKTLQQRFPEYFREAKKLQQEYAHFEKPMNLSVGFETEWYGKSPEKWLRLLMESFEPQVIVASVHHVGSMPIDYDEAEFRRAAEHCGGIERLVEAYYEEQYELLQFLAEEASIPVVVGHVDLIRKFSKELRALPLIRRNLEFAAERGFLVEYNARGPYPHPEIRQELQSLGALLTLSDDSHAVKDVGRGYDEFSLNQVFGLDDGVVVPIPLP